MKRQTWERRLIFPVLFFTLVLLTSCSGNLPSATWFGVTAVDDTVYLAANKQVFALDLESGDELWAFPPQPDKEIDSFYATPLLVNDALVVGSFTVDGQFYAVSQDEGNQEWVVKTEGRIVAGATSTTGRVVVGNDKGEVYLIDTETQDKRVLLEADESIWATPLLDEANERAFIACMDHHLYAIDLESGEQLWAFEAGGALAGTPALGDGVLYFGDLNNTFYAVDAGTGAQVWRFPTKGWVWGGPLFHSGTVFFGDLSGKLYALDATDASERWTFEAEGGVRVTPVLADGLLYFGDRKGKVYAIRAEDGAQEWIQSLDGAIYGQPVIQRDYLLVMPHNAKVKLVALDTEGLAERWSYPPREE